MNDRIAIPSSSSSTCSRPTFCPRECLALEPHTIALRNLLMSAPLISDKHLLLHLFSYLLVNGVTKVFDSAFPAPEDHRGIIVWREPPGFRVNSDKVKSLPHFFDQFVNIEPFAR